MSFRIPRFHRRRSSNSPSKTIRTPTAECDAPSFPIQGHLVEHHILPHQRRGYGTRGLVKYRTEVLLAEPGGHKFTQPLIVAAKHARPHVQLIDDNEDLNEDPFVVNIDPESDHPQSLACLHIREVNSIPADQLKAQWKKERQWAKWANDTIPSLVKPYLQHLYLTQSLRDPPPNGYERRNCNCGNEGFLTVTCVYFERKWHFYFYLSFRKYLFFHCCTELKSISIKHCKCFPVALSLMSWGLFPCTPTAPTLAVDLSVLDFVRELFLRVAPNTSAWCETLECFLATRRYKLTTRVIYFQFISIGLCTYVTSRTHFDTDSEIPCCGTPALSVPPCNIPKILLKTVGGFCQVNQKVWPDILHQLFYSPGHPGSSNSSASSHTNSRLRPSEYLRRRCPLCYGGVYVHDSSAVYVTIFYNSILSAHWFNYPWVTSADFLNCVDACFTHKRLKMNGQSDRWDPPHHHPDTVFMADDDVKAMEAFVESCRSHAPPQPQPQSDSADYLEPGMQIPASILNDCRDSFVAADEKRQKASTQFFADTSIMALLCRHDRVLWTINMTSAGEKQYYVLALIKRLFEHLPHDATVGILYDIGCQLHRSCKKWGFLAEYLPRLSFAISVFHAFGHQWPCQIVYHPRKRIGFGLMDGEGCERFWSALKALIPSLRVSGVSWFSCCLLRNADLICHSITNASSRLMLRLGILMQNRSTR